MSPSPRSTVTVRSSAPIAFVQKRQCRDAPPHGHDCASLSPWSSRPIPLDGMTQRMRSESSSFPRRGSRSPLERRVGGIFVFSNVVHDPVYRYEAEYVTKHPSYEYRGIAEDSPRFTRCQYRSGRHRAIHAENAAAASGFIHAHHRYAPYPPTNTRLPLITTVGWD